MSLRRDISKPTKLFRPPAPKPLAAPVIVYDAKGQIIKTIPGNNRKYAPRKKPWQMRSIKGKKDLYPSWE